MPGRISAALASISGKLKCARSGSSALKKGLPKPDDIFIGTLDLYVADRYELISKTDLTKVFRAKSFQDPSMPLVIKAASINRDPGNQNLPTTCIVRNEQSILARLGQFEIPGITKLIDHGELKLPFIILPRLDGLSLDVIMERAGEVRKHPDFVAFVVHLLDSLLRILTDVHEAGVIHRDIKPGNIFIIRNGEVYLIDFGLSIVPAGDNVLQTEPESFFGTLQYVAPEQIDLSADYSQQTGKIDLYELAASMFSLLDGKPFLECQTSIESIIRRKRYFGIPAPSSADLNIPSWLGDFISWMGKADPKDRPDSARTALQTLQAKFEEGHQPRPLSPERAAAFMNTALFSVHGGIELEDYD